MINIDRSMALGLVQGMQDALQELSNMLTNSPEVPEPDPGMPDILRDLAAKLEKGIAKADVPDPASTRTRSYPSLPAGPDGDYALSEVRSMAASINQVVINEEGNAEVPDTERLAKYQQHHDHVNSLKA